MVGRKDIDSVDFVSKRYLCDHPFLTGYAGPVPTFRTDYRLVVSCPKDDLRIDFIRAKSVG